MRRFVMPKYLFEASYTTEGTKGLLKEGGSGRQALIEKMTREMGGKLEAFYFAFGDPDVYVIVDIPDPVSAAAVSLAINSSGAVRLRTVALLTPEEIDEASKKSINYRPPGA
jgi:uncharacterized protein with GYD domain